MYPHEEAFSGTKFGPVELSSHVPPVEASVANSGTRLGLVDQLSPVLPSRSIYLPQVVLHQVSLTFGHPLGQVDHQSDVSPE